MRPNELAVLSWTGFAFMCLAVALGINSAADWFFRTFRRPRSRSAFA